MLGGKREHGLHARTPVGGQGGSRPREALHGWPRGVHHEGDRRRVRLVANGVGRPSGEGNHVAGAGTLRARYHGYRAFFPLWAMARYRNLKQGNSRQVLHGL